MLTSLSLRFLEYSEGGAAIPSRVDLRDDGPGLTFVPGDSVPLVLPGRLVSENGLAVEVAFEGEGTLRAAWPGGVSEPVSSGEATIFSLPSGDLFAQGVAIRDLEIDWQTQSDGEWTSLGKSTHRCYLTLDIPTDPWHPKSTYAGTAKRVWTDLLEFACAWATDCKDMDSACAAITRGLFESGRFVYDTNNGASNYTQNDYFECDEFINRLQNEEGNGEKLNCSDCATMVSTMANAMGAQLYQVRLEGNFKVQPIRAIGTNYWASPFNGGFSYHELAWNGHLDATGAIYDACLQVDENSPILPVQMPYDDALVDEAKRYRSQLTKPGEDGYDSCQPYEDTVIIREID